MSEDELRKRLESLKALTGDQSRPNVNSLWEIAKDLEIIKLNLKFFGYDLAKALVAALPPPPATGARRVGLKSKPSTQSDIESDWFAHWCSELKIPTVMHRKLWEFAYALQALFEDGHIREGTRGLGFGCGTEPLPSYLASKGVKVTVTDLAAEDDRSKGWSATAQHTRSLEQAFHSRLVDRETFLKQADLRFVDMNHIPEDLKDYDFCWSICALEHVGSIRQGLEFIENSLETLRPGGLAVHTTEFNFLNDEETIDNWGTVLFQRKHFLEVSSHLREMGHYVADLDFDVGNKPMDKFIDLPPYDHDFSDYMKSIWAGQQQHVKLAIDGFASTCFGLIIRKS